MALDPRIAATIVARARQYGQNPDYLQRQAVIESGGNPNAQNPRSSAGGLFQFTDGTAKQYGLTDKFNPDASADAAARLARDNGVFLSNRLGRDPTSGELYLAHQQGAGGAAKLLANPDALAADLVGAKAVTGNGGSPDMTAAQFASRWTSKFDDMPAPSGPTMTMPGDTPAASGYFGFAGVEPGPAAAPAMTMPETAPAKDDGPDVAGILKTLLGSGGAPAPAAQASPAQPRSILPDAVPRAMPFDLSSFLGRLSAR